MPRPCLDVGWERETEGVLDIFLGPALNDVLRFKGLMVEN
jgi:hypothetical protein